MNELPASPRKKWPVKRIIVFTLASVLLIASIFLYRNFNRLIAESLMKSFNSGIASEVYELKFDNLSVNPFVGTIQVYNVTIQPRKNPIHTYPYINSSMNLKTDRLTLKDVELLTLLRFKKLNLKIISITRPDVDLILRGKRHIFLPFKDTVTSAKVDNTNKPSLLGSFMLDEFHLIEAAAHVTNEYKQREFKISNFTITLKDLLIGSKPGEHST
jgi:hypothetical protein